MPFVVMVMVPVFHLGPDSSHRLKAQDLDFTAVPKLTCGLTNQGAVGAINSAGLLSATTVTNVLNGMSLSTAGKDTARTPLVNASDVAVGDFNGDGCQDIAQIDRMTPVGSLQVLTGYGDGSFGFWRHYPLPSGATLIDTMNADGDKIDDLVIGEPGGLQIFPATYMLGGAAGPTRVQLPYTPTVVATNDDLGAGAAITLAIGGRMADGTFRINGLKTGTATMTSPVVTGITTQIDVADGVIEDIEIVATSDPFAVPVGVAVPYAATGLFTAGSSGVTAYDITNVATWTATNPTIATVTNAGPGRGVITTPATNFEFVDVNNDGLDDILILTDDDQLQVSTATRTQIAATPDRPAGFTVQYNAVATYSDGTTPEITRDASWVVDDLNADGNVDILVGGAPGQNGLSTVIRLQGNGTGQFVLANRFTVTGLLSDGNTVDLNGDDSLEILSTGPNGPVITDGRPGGLSITAPVFNGVTGAIDRDNRRRFFLAQDAYADVLKTLTDAQINQTFGVDRNTITNMVRPGAVYTNDLVEFTKANAPLGTVTYRTTQAEWAPLTPEQRAAIREIMRPFARSTGASETAKAITALVEPGPANLTTGNKTTAPVGTTGSPTTTTVPNSGPGEFCSGPNCTPTPTGSVTRPTDSQRGFLKIPPDKLREFLDGERLSSNAARDYCDLVDCAAIWGNCLDTNSCESVDEDCILSGACLSDNGGRYPIAHQDLREQSGWNTTANTEVETRIQIKMGDIVLTVSIQPQRRAQIGDWFNPLGLLARRLRDNMERWSGSAGPRSMVRPRDIELMEEYSSGQSVGLPKGVHLLLTDRGGSTGKTLAMHVLNLSGESVRLSSLPFVIEPIKQQAQQRVQQAFTRLAKAAPVRLDLAGYCLEFFKLPPSANQIFRLAPAAVQKKYEPMSKVLRSAFRVHRAGRLRPDSNPAAYSDSIKQWAVWAVEQKFNEKGFTDAFLGHTKKNVEAAGQQWSKPAEDMVRKVSPNRWRDIVKVLQGAGLPVPR